MEIDCILKFYIKDKGKPERSYIKTPLDDAVFYKDNNNYHKKWELQIVSLDEHGEPWEVLKTVEVNPENKSTIYYINFNKIQYAYSTYLDMIFCTTTRLTI